MESRSVILLHGFGVRSYFWDQVRPLFADVFETVLAPDLRTDNITTLLDTTKDLIRRCAEQDGAPVSLVGHSLGGIVSAIAARDLGPEVVEQIAVIASPFGERQQAPSPILRFLLKHHLIPDFLTRPRFFSSHTPKEIQKRIFSQAVDEPPELLEMAFQKRWFHTDFFTEPLAQPTLVIYSESDRIVPPLETQHFARALGAETRVLPRERRVAHDDLLASPTISRELADWIITYFKRNHQASARGG